MIAGTLVWLRGQRGPEPQRWPIGTTARLRSENKDRVLAEHPLNEGEFGLTIFILEQRYKAPIVAEEAKTNTGEKAT